MTTAYRVLDIVSLSAYNAHFDVVSSIVVRQHQRAHFTVHVVGGMLRDGSDHCAFFTLREALDFASLEAQGFIEDR